MHGQGNTFRQKNGCGFRAFRNNNDNEPTGRGLGIGRELGLGQGRGCGHGGARRGAGRPSNGFCQRVQLRLTEEQKEFWLNSPELQEEIRELINKKMSENNSES